MSAELGGPGPSHMGVGVIEGDSIESVPLIRSNAEEQSTTGQQSAGKIGGYGMSGKKYGRKRTRTVSIEGTLSPWYDFSTTTVIGLFLLLAMTSLTILSVCLQRYSTNKYIDIIVPPSANASVNGTAPEIIL